MASKDSPEQTRTVSVTIARPADAVYDYIATIENFPRWSTFIRGVRREGDHWIFETAAGESRVSFVPRNAWRVLDHEVTIAQGQVVSVPLRVVPNGRERAEVLFTVFRQPTMTDQQFAEDIAMVEADLASLRRVLETAPR